MLNSLMPQWIPRGYLGHFLYFSGGFALARGPIVLPYALYSRKSSTSSSSRRWQLRQRGDIYAKEARLRGLKSRAAFKLLELDHRYSIFKRGQTVVDLGFAPGSWSQVAVDRTGPSGRVIGIDVIPVQPPKGASAIQGNFLSLAVREEVRRYVQDDTVGCHREAKLFALSEERGEKMTIEDLDEASKGYFELETNKAPGRSSSDDSKHHESLCVQELYGATDETVDVVLSDMSAPWELSLRPSANSLINPYFRMMNTSGNSFRDHIGSMNLCNAALQFASQTLKIGGAMVCKFYQGVEDKHFEGSLKKFFTKVYRDKPNSSRGVSYQKYGS